MKYRTAFAFSMFLIFMLACTAAIARDAKIVNESRIRNLLGKNGRIPVIVTMKIDKWNDPADAPAASHNSRPGTPPISNPDAQLASAIENTSGSILSTLPANSYAFKRSFKVIPAMAMSINENALQALAANPRVENVYEDQLTQIPPITPAESPSISSPQLNQSTPLIGADRAWSMGFTGKGTYVAILDTGVRTSHEMFRGKNVVEACYSTNDDQWYMATSLCPNGQTSQKGAGAAAPRAGSHGTHVAGIAAGNNPGYSLGEAYRGVAPDADIIAVQVFTRFDGPVCDEYKIDSPCYLTFPSDQISGLEYVYALRDRYTIGAVNMSLGGGEYSSYCDSESPLNTMIGKLRAAKIATVIATGNDGYCGAVASPSCISSAVAVGASDKYDVEAWYNNYHPTLQEFFAPGSGILSATAISNSSYAAWDGTSMATPHVAGAFAVLRGASPDAGVTTIENALKDRGTSVAGLCIKTTAIPRINVDLALQNFRRNTGMVPAPINLLLLRPQKEEE